MHLLTHSIFKRFALFCLCALAAFGQGAQGTITGTVTDATGAVVVGAHVEAKHVDTGVVYPTQATETGNYAITQLPVGKYEVSVTAQGFKKYDRQGLTLSAQQTMRIDVGLQVGANTESVTVTAEATLLKTESSQVVHNVSSTQLLELPIMSVGGAGTGSTAGFRDPFALTRLIPGSTYFGPSAGGESFNGAPATDTRVLLEGQVNGNLGGLNGFTAQTQMSVDAVQEVAVQTSNYAAEFGNAGAGGIINMTMKSGGNQYHGSLYDYAVNEILNSAPSMHTADKGAARRHDYGMTFGGPIRIPKVYDGTNKTFFFWSWEQFRENLVVQPGTGSAASATVPLDPYRVGNFQPAIDAFTCAGGPCHIQVSGKDYVNALGGTGFLEGQIFDSYTSQGVLCDKTKVPTATCTPGVTSIVRLPFPSVANCNGTGVTTINCLPNNAAYRDPVSANMQQLFPEPKGGNAGNNAYVNNYQNPWNSHRTSQIPSIKGDHTVGGKGHLSIYWQNTVTESQYSFPLGNMEGFPTPITGARGTFIYAYADRANYDHTLTPAILLHLGAGWTSQDFDDHSPVAAGGYNACTPFTTLAAAQATGGLGLCGGLQNRTFPSIGFGSSGTSGGMTAVGPAANIQSRSYEQRPSGNANVTYVKGNHNFKLGAEWRKEAYPAKSFGADGAYTFAGGQTGQPSTGDTGGSTLTNNSTGFGYASFLMGWTSNVSLTAPPADTQTRQVWSLFLQDTWKVTRKFTLDYGIRWDYNTYTKEEFGRGRAFSPTIANPGAAGHPGGSIFEATCGCSFVPNDNPYMIGPRVGFAYQIDRKTVFRGGVGVVYSVAAATTAPGGITLSTGPGVNPGDKSSQFSTGATTLHPVWPTFTPDAGFTVGSINLAPSYYDPQHMQSPRVYQFSAGLQREIHRNLVVEASYVGNRGIWLNASGLSPLNSISPTLLNRFGFSFPTGGVVTQANLDDRSLLAQTLSSETATQNSTLAGRNIGVLIPGCAPSSPANTAKGIPLCASVPYAGYPTTGAVSATLVPFPQYFGISSSNNPAGRSWYDSLQVVATQRLSHGFTFNTNYTFSKSLTATGSPDPYNRDLAKSSALPTQLLRFSVDYVSPKLHSSNKILGNKVLSYALSEWGVGWYGAYASAGFLGRPGNTAVNFNSPSANPFAACSTTSKTGLNAAGTGCADPTQSVCPYSRIVGSTDLGCTMPISNWLGYGTGGMQLKTDPATGQPMNPWSVNWTDYAGVHHTDPIDVNCHCFDPTKTVVFNPDAWVSTPAGTFTSDFSVINFRGIRNPTENINVSRTFRLKERMSLQVRVEFANMFNRLQLGNPSLGGITGNFSTFKNTTGADTGLYTTGYGTFGNISPLTGGTSPGNPRSGTFVARLQF